MPSLRAILMIQNGSIRNLPHHRTTGEVSGRRHERSTHQPLPVTLFSMAHHTGDGLCRSRNNSCLFELSLQRTGWFLVSSRQAPCCLTRLDTRSATQSTSVEAATSGILNVTCK